MNKPFLAILAIAGIVFAGSPLAGLGAEKHDPNLAPLQPIVGQWKVTFKAADPPASRQYTVTYHWVIGGKFLEAVFLDEKGAHDCTEMFGWDAADKVVKIWGFDPGSLYEGALTFQGNVWKSQFSSVRPSGERLKENVVLTFEKDSFTAIGTRSDTKAPSFEARFTRIKDGK